MKLPAFVRLTVRNVMVNTDPGTMFFMFGIPIFYLLVMGLLYQGIITGIPVNGVLIPYTTFLAPGIVGMQAFTAGNIGGGMLWADRRWGMFEQLLVGPFRRSEYLFGIIFLSVIFAIGGSLIMIILASLIKSATFSMSLLSYAYLIAALVTGTILFSSLFLIISIKARSMNAYSTITFLLFFLLDFASTAFYPITSNTPLPLRIVSAGNPLSYIVDVMRDSMVYGISYSTLFDLGIITALMAVVLPVSILLYGNVRTGIQ
ncbi:MAG: ABC transporter permease [Candidatus Thermoplasmatota archaeon]|jgi:ABC-2 type transport system permease protein|nr:ABC transporter permease [Candidatus Thermoplasmatota archaeon]MCL5800863.1 ABC transporter permease [Candidatus Thermoplasmatota archaeon]